LFSKMRRGNSFIRVFLGGMHRDKGLRCGEEMTTL
jgi:hypothetical protein